MSAHETLRISYDMHTLNSISGLEMVPQSLLSPNMYKESKYFAWICYIDFV